MLKITKVKRKSVAKELGLEVKDEVLAFDGFACEDELDYLYYVDKERFTMTVRDFRSGEEREVLVEKEAEEDVGLEFEKRDSIRTCHNHCVFCFVDQMPKGLRKSLYVKDDDYAMSFTCGNFVTLTNLSDEGLERIIRLRLSPLYISVHTTNAEVRCRLLRNRFAGKIRTQIKRLAEAGIEMHCQAVIVPGENDGADFENTARELFSYYPYVQDLACVPTGLTKYREGLAEIADVDGAYSADFLDMVDRLNGEFGVNFVLPADEYFVKSGRDFKTVDFYGDFEQIENGIGMTSLFISEVKDALAVLPKNAQGRYALKKKKSCLIISGVSAYGVNMCLAKEAEAVVDGLSCDVLAVENAFFGKTVTCTGLLTGVDMLAAVKEYLQQTAVDEIILAGNTMKEFEEVFLCGMTLTEFKKGLLPYKVKVCVNRGGGSGLIKILTNRK